jgi:hypothetical protein
MLCKIADLLVEVPETGGLAPRIGAYRYESDRAPDIVIREEDYRRSPWKNVSHELFCYMESGSRFYVRLLGYDGLMLHASAIAYKGQAYLFSGPSGVGKSTHTRLWKSVLGEEVQVFNDDKPALRRLDGKWYAYGTPWCGKDGININMRVPLAGICFLRQAPENRITALSPEDAIPEIVSQTLNKLRVPKNRELLLTGVLQLSRDIPVFMLENRADEEAVLMSNRAMTAAALKMK